jgi:hypothetical protein
MWIVISLVFLQVCDVFLHVASGAIEPMRIGASLGVVIAVVLSNYLASPRIRNIILTLSLAAYLVLNGIYIGENGLPGVAFWVFVATTSALLVVLITRSTTPARVKPRAS